MTYYAKLANGRLKYAPVNLETETGVIFNYGLEVNAHQLLADGYKPVELLADRSGYSDCDGTFLLSLRNGKTKLLKWPFFIAIPTRRKRSRCESGEICCLSRRIYWLPCRIIRSERAIKKN